MAVLFLDMKQVPIFTSMPETPAPILNCPTCDSQLTYRQTVFGGVRPPERWDHLECRPCGRPYEYRHRTRQRRPTANVG